MDAGDKVNATEQGQVQRSATDHDSVPNTSTKDIETAPAHSTSVNVGKTQININEKLKETLAKHGISKQNAHSFLKGLLMDKDFKSLVKSKLDDEEEEDEEEENAEELEPPDVRMTRSRLKEVLQKSPFKTPWPLSPQKNDAEKNLPKFMEISLSDNDEDDDEYHPMESSFDNDTCDLPQNSDVEKVNETDAPEGREKNENSFDNLGELVVVELDEPAEKASASGDCNKDLICSRTRSKHSLQATSLDVLEAAFQPPDATADMYDVSIGDYDWQKWLTDLMKDSGTGNSGLDVDDDDPEEDPDFNFIPELDKPDEEDLRDDTAVRISKKELNNLLDEIDKIQDEDWSIVNQPYGQVNDSFNDAYAEGNFDNEMSSTSVTDTCGTNPPSCPVVPFLSMTQNQIEILRQQMQQHVQLIAQTNILCRNRKDLRVYVTQSKILLRELTDIGNKQMQSLSLSSSAVIPFNVNGAIELTERFIPPSEPCIRLVRMERIKGHTPIPTAIAEVMANSPVFTYSQLLPMSAPVEPTFSYKNSFSNAEDCLIAHGLEQMSCFKNFPELISVHMLPIRTAKQIQIRIRNIMYCRNHKDWLNPITKYQTCKVLPKPSSGIKHVDPKNASKPIDMKDPMLPNWLLAQKPMYEGVLESDDFSQSIENLQVSTDSSVLSVKVTLPPSDEVRSQLTGILVPYIPVAIPEEKEQASSAKEESEAIAKVSEQSSSLATGICEQSPACDITGPVKKHRIPTHPQQKQQGLHNVIQGNNGNEKTLASLRLDPNISYKPVPMKDVEVSHPISTRKQPGPMDVSYRDPMPTDYFPPVSSSSSEEEDNDELVCAENSISDENNLTQDKYEVQKEENEISDVPSHPSKTQNKNNRKHPPLRIKFSKTKRGFRTQQHLGGYLKKIHPKLSIRKTKTSSKDVRALQSTSRMIKALEEETIVQLDPKRVEKENIFAMGYHDRVKEALADRPEVYEQFLEILIKYGDGTRSPVELYGELESLLDDWPDLLQAFAPFLMPEQAVECNLYSEQQLYSRARKFLRQLEIQFKDNPEHMEKILNVFHTVAGTAIYREEEMMKSILGLLKDYPYLQDEFLTFFDDQYPPELHLQDDYEEIDLMEDLSRDTSINQFEFIQMPAFENSTGNRASNSHPEPCLKRGKKRQLSTSSSKLVSKSAQIVSPVSAENKENEYPEGACLDADDEAEELFNLDEDESEGEEVDSLEICDNDISVHENVEDKTSLPPDVTIISEDALTASPFKRITENSNASESDLSLRPATPTGIRSETMQSISISQFPSIRFTSDELAPLPVTPGKTIKDTSKKKQSAVSPSNIRFSNAWTREMDEVILSRCKSEGTNPNTFEQIAQKINRTSRDVEKRLAQLIAILTGENDNDTTSQESEDDMEMTESDVSQDCCNANVS